MTMTADTRPELTDRLVWLYCDWRSQCAGVRAAYEQFAVAPAAERAVAFAAYQAALDREASAAATYAQQIRQLGNAATHRIPPIRSQPTADSVVET